MSSACYATVAWPFYGPLCGRPAGHAGWHRDGNSEWVRQPTVDMKSCEHHDLALDRNGNLVCDTCGAKL